MRISAALLLVLAACGDSNGPISPEPDATAGDRDAGESDRDAGESETDGGVGPARDAGPPPPPAEAWFRADFNEESESYAFDGHYPTESWHYEHMPAGGFDGSGAVHIVMHAGETQYSFGFWTPHFHDFAMGDGVYFRFRIRYDAAMRAHENWGNKFIMMGETDDPLNSRIIIGMRPPSESSGCTLGFRDASMDPAPVFPWATPAHFGITSHASFEERELAEVSWSLQPTVNIGWSCGPPVYQTIPANPFGARPGPAGSAVAVDGWYHIQIYAESGAPGSGAFRTWANNNELGAPSAEQVGLADGLGVVGWGGAVVGGYMDNDTPSIDLGYTIDDFEIGPAFDPTWYR